MSDTLQSILNEFKEFVESGYDLSDATDRDRLTKIRDDINRAINRATIELMLS